MDGLTIINLQRCILILRTIGCLLWPSFQTKKKSKDKEAVPLQTSIKDPVSHATNTFQFYHMLISPFALVQFVP